MAGISADRHAQRVRRVIGLAGEYAAVKPTLTGRENLIMVARLFGRSRRQAATRKGAVLKPIGADRCSRPPSAKPTPAACGAGSISVQARGVSVAGLIVGPLENRPHRWRAIIG
jgi:hypothetical protein